MKSITNPIKISLFIIIVSILSSSCSNTEKFTPVKRDIIDAVFASGQVIYENEYLITANTEGYLTEKYVSEADQVKMGSSLFQLSNESQSAQVANARATYENARFKLSEASPQINQLKLDIEQAKLQMDLDQQNYDRYAGLVKTGAVSQLEFDKVKLQLEASERNFRKLQQSLEDLITTHELNLKNAETQLIIQQENNDNYFLSTNIDGIVLQVYKKEGELVRRGEVVAKIGGGSKRVKLFIAEQDINLIQLDQEVVISLNTQTDDVINGRISKLYPSFDANEQSFIAEATLTSKPASIYHNTQLQANIIISDKKQALVIPTDYILNSQVITENGSKTIETGIQTDEWTEVIAGLAEDEVIIKPAQL